MSEMMLYTDYFGLDDQAKLGNPQQDPAKLEQEWEKLKFGYKVKMPQEYVKKNQYKSTQKADDIDYQICPNDQKKAEEKKATTENASPSPQKEKYNFYSSTKDDKEDLSQSCSPDRRSSKKSDKGSRKVSIKPEDIMIEYSTRLMKILKDLNEAYLTSQQKDQISNFIQHP